MDTHRKLWNQVQQKLRRALSAKDPRVAIELFLHQHAMVHSRTIAKSELWSFEDEVLDDMSEQQIRWIPSGEEHSVAWILFHLARIEDITMNILIAGTPQLFVHHRWTKELNVNVLHSANRMDERGVASLGAQINIGALRAYRQAVGSRTRDIVRRLRQEEFEQKVQPSRLQQVMDEGALRPEAIEILNYWSKRTVAGLLLMPPTRHNFLHLNEALRIKQKLPSADVH